MDNRTDLFHPESVNDQVGHLARIQDSWQRDITPGAPTIAALQSIYTEDEAMLERAWARLASAEAATQSSGGMTNSVDRHYYRGENTIQETHFSAETSGPVMPSSPTFVRPPHRPRWGRRHVIGLLAAVLVCVTLIGSLSLVLTVSRSQTASISADSHSTTATAQISTPIVTPGLTIPSTCKDNADLADEVLCAKGEETILNITKSFTVNGHNPNGAVNGSGTVNITFHRAYADTSRLMLVYTINRAPATDWGGFVTISTTPQANIGSDGGCLVKGFCVQSFDTSSLPASTTQLHIKTINTAYGASIPLTFTLPFHTASKTVTVKQTASNKGNTLTLDHLVLTNSTAIFAFTFKAQATQSIGRPTPMLQAVIINGQQQAIAGSTSHYGANGTGELSGSLNLYQSFLGQPGSWTVKLSLVNVNPGPTFSPVLTGTFIFTVPA